jgi:hypothetical protein
MVLEALHAVSHSVLKLMHGGWQGLCWGDRVLER